MIDELTARIQTLPAQRAEIDAMSDELKELLGIIPARTPPNPRFRKLTNLASIVDNPAENSLRRRKSIRSASGDFTGMVSRHQSESSGCRDFPSPDAS
jgi:hypothetical protein